MCKKDGGIVMVNFAALRAAVFPLSTKNFRGADIRPPSVRGLKFGMKVVDMSFYVIYSGFVKLKKGFIKVF